jgi:DNA-binding MarR family transcriptional regulator
VGLTVSGTVAGRQELVCLGALARAEGLAAAQIAGRLRAHHLSVTAFNALTALSQAGRPLCPRELSERLLISRGAVTQILDLLVTQGRIHRRPHPHDRRSLLIGLTLKGRRVLARAQPEVAEATSRTLAGLSPQEQTVLAALLRKLEHHVQTLSISPARTGGNTV